MLDRLTTMFANRGALHMSAADGELHPTEVRRVRFVGAAGGGAGRGKGEGVGGGLVGGWG